MAEVDAEISVEFQVSKDLHDDHPAVADQVPTWKAVFMIFRSLVGIGVLMMPHSIQHFGINGALLTFLLFGAALLYIIDLLIEIASDLGFNGGK